MADRYQDRPLPADDQGRGGNQASSRGESDPLAELARLIGQTDPFAGLGRSNQPARARGNVRDPYQPPQQAQPQQPPLIPQPPLPQQPVVQQPPMPQRPITPQQPQQPQAAPETDGSLAGGGPPAWMQRSQQQSPQDLDSIRQPPRFPPEGAVPNYQPSPAFTPSVDPPQRVADQDRYEDALFGQMPGAVSGGLPQDQGYDDPYGYQDDYDDGLDLEPKPRRRGMFTFGVLVALAVVGTGGAYAYRSFFGSPAGGEPPIIRADNGPNKILPPTQSGDSSGKLIQDRLAGGGGTEKLVSREEQPMDLRDGRSGPRVIFPPLNQNSNPPSPASVAQPLNRPSSASGSNAGSNAGNAMSNIASSSNLSGGVNGNLEGDEPRKIHTLTVRGGEQQQDPAAAAVAVAKPSAGPATRSVSATTLRNQPPAAANANASANSPMSIAPQAPASAEPRTRAASINTPQPVTAAPAAAGGGGYLVQVSSQSSEADAQKSFKSLQGKYPDLLGSREPLIKRADVGGKTVYRAMVGPFDSSGEANQFCSGLKTAGGQCFVPRN